MAKSPNWSTQEIDLLKTIYPIEGCSSNLLMQLPGRNSKGIGIKASRLGLKVLNPWNKLLTTDEYITKINKYNISVVAEYINDRTEILHKCNKCSTEWMVRPNNVINGHGCPTCKKGYGLLPNYSVESASIYLIEIRLIDGEHFLKIGVTSNDTNLRFVNIKSNINSAVGVILFDVVARRFTSGVEATELESKILFDNSIYKFISKHTFNGYTELLNISEKDRLINIINL